MFVVSQSSSFDGSNFYLRSNPSGFISGVSFSGYAKIQRLRAATDVNGNYSWKYDIAYNSGVIPIVQVAVEQNNSTDLYDHKILVINNTGCIIKVLKSSVVSILSIDVLTSLAGSSCTLHLAAIEP